MRLKHNESAGFTLTEILIVMAIVSVLGWLAYPSYLEATRKAKRAEGRAALLMLMQQQERFHSQHNSYMAFSASSTDEQARKFRWHSGGSAKHSAYEISGEACEGESIGNCIRLIAVPGTARVDAGYADPVCGRLSLASSGIRQPDRPECWR